MQPLDRVPTVLSMPQTDAQRAWYERNRERRRAARAQINASARWRYTLKKLDSLGSFRILVDVDDVLFPWFDKAHAACERAGITNGRTPTSWECFRDYGVTLEEWLEVMRTATLDGSLYTGDPYPGAIEALRALRAAGHTLHIVTARGFFEHGDLIRKATVAWLAEWDVPHDSLTFTKDKVMVRTDVAIDDSWENVNALSNAGVATWLIDAPHNQGCEYPHRVTSVQAFAELILARRGRDSL